MEDGREAGDAASSPSRKRAAAEAWDLEGEESTSNRFCLSSSAGDPFMAALPPQDMAMAAPIMPPSSNLQLRYTQLGSEAPRKKTKQKNT